MKRRTFAAAAANAALAGRVAGANERLRAGVIGAGGRGRLLTAEFKEIGVEMGAVCDVYQPNLDAGLSLASSGAKAFDDYRRLLDDKSLDAVIVATPDHWHARMVIDAVEAGKDVYVEKPLCHTIEEGFAVVDAVKRTGRVVQVGTQRRSSDLFQAAKQLIDTKPLGDVRLVTSWWYNRQDGINDRKLEGKLDWQQWLGTAPKRAVDQTRFFNWYYYWDYSGGLLIGQAAHIVDAIHWFMDSRRPAAVTCIGGQVNLPGVEIPETASLVIEYPENYLATFTIGYKAMRYPAARDQLKEFHGNKARLAVGREGYALFPESKELDPKPVVDVQRPGSFGPATRQHIRNFLDCIKSRKQPNATVEHGFSTAIVLSMALDSMRQGRRLRWNERTRKVEG